MALITNVQALRRMPRFARNLAAAHAVAIALATPSSQVRAEMCFAYRQLVLAGADIPKNGDLLLRGPKAVDKVIARRELASNWLAGAPLATIDPANSPVAQLVLAEAAAIVSDAAERTSSVEIEPVAAETIEALA